jgi:hypothetical protein
VTVAASTAGEPARGENLSGAQRNSREETADPASKLDENSVRCRQKRTYGDERRELFRPTRRQIEDARSWLVRVIARRAVDILKAQETGP